MTGPLGLVDLPAPIGDRWFEDYVTGCVYEFGHVSLSEADIVGFAQRYDPQSIHTDPAWSSTGPFDGLIASGVHTIAVCMRLYVDHYISHVASLASPGLDEIRWPRSVRPGDRLRIRVTVAEARASRSKPDRGLVHSAVEALNQRGRSAVVHRYELLRPTTQTVTPQCCRDDVDSLKSRGLPREEGNAVRIRRAGVNRPGSDEASGVPGRFTFPVESGSGFC